MRFPSVALSVLATVSSAAAFQLVTPPASVRVTGTSSLEIRASHAMDAGEVDLFYDDAEEDPSEMKVGEIRAELDRMNCDYSDCFDRKELEARLREAREYPSLYQKTPSQGGGSLFGYEDQDQGNGKVGMKSVETSFVGLKQNSQAGPKKRATIFGSDDGVIEVEPIKYPQGNSFVPPRRSNSNAESRGPSRWSNDDTLIQDSATPTPRKDAIGSGYESMGGGQSLHGYLEEEEPYPTKPRGWTSQEESKYQRSQSFFGGSPQSQSYNYSPKSEDSKKDVTDAAWSRSDFDDMKSQLDALKRRMGDVKIDDKDKSDTSNRWSSFDGVKTQQDPGQDRFNKQSHPKTSPTRWSTFDGIQVESPGDNKSNFVPPSNPRSQRINVEQLKERRSRQGSSDGTTMWNGIRVEPSETSHTKDPFRATRQQGRYDAAHDANTYFKADRLNLEPPPKEFKKADAQEKKKYTDPRDFRYDQTNKRTNVFQGVQVEDVPLPDDIKVSSYKREEQANTGRNFRYDPQRAEQHAYYNGVHVECAPGSRPPPGTFRAPAVNNENKVKNQGRSASFGGVRNKPDDLFNKRTLEHLNPPATNGVGPAQSGYEGVWENTVGGSNKGNNSNGNDDSGSIPGAMDIDGRL